MGGGDFNPHYFEYPSLYMYFMLFNYGIYFLIGKLFGIFHTANEFAQLYIKNPTSFHMIGRLWETIFNLGIILTIYSIAKKIFTQRTAWIAIFFLAILPSAVNTGHVTKGDMSVIFLGILFWWMTYKIYETGESKYYYFAGALLGLAFSTKYYIAMIGITLPVAHFLRRPIKSIQPLILAFILIPLFFAIGTPYCFTQEFIIAFKEIFLGFNTQAADYWGTFHHRPFPIRLLLALKKISMMAEDQAGHFIGGTGLGILGIVGLIWMVLQKNSLRWFFIAPAIAFWIVVAAYFSPTAGYVAPLFPFLILTAAYLIDSMIDLFFTKKKYLISIPILIFTLFAFISAADETLVISYRYTLKDTRTSAKEWIEKNIPFGTKILMDMIPYSPPLEMTYSQLKKFTEIAEKTNHYKKDFFKLKLEITPPTLSGYEIFLIKKSAGEIGSLPDMTEQVQKTQDLFEIQGMNLQEELANLKKYNIEYLITNGAAEMDAIGKIPRLEKFYGELKSQLKPIKEFNPPSKHNFCPIIKIYKI